jgi:NAD(P)-dependent dehydrogenase (short-subunit alcohol dehydrogenase family)
MDLELKDKVVVVSGGAKGIGEGITRGFAKEGAIVVALGRSPGIGQSIVDSITSSGGRCHFKEVELTDEVAVGKVIQSVLEELGRIDVVVNNAGVNDAISLRHSPKDFARSLDRNIVHYFSLVHYALDALMETKGTIINIGSKIAETGQGGTSGYAAANGGINALTREWAADLAKYEIRVNCVVPAEVLTPQYDKWLQSVKNPEEAIAQLKASVPLGKRTTTVEEIADTVVFTASVRSSHTTGQILFVDGGYAHLDRALTASTTHLKSS